VPSAWDLESRSREEAKNETSQYQSAQRRSARRAGLGWKRPEGESVCAAARKLISRRASHESLGRFLFGKTLLGVPLRSEIQFLTN
jgi:hypothetical protein